MTKRTDVPNAVIKQFCFHNYCILLTQYALNYAGDKIYLLVTSINAHWL